MFIHYDARHLVITFLAIKDKRNIRICLNSFFEPIMDEHFQRKFFDD